MPGSRPLRGAGLGGTPTSRSHLPKPMNTRSEFLSWVSQIVLSLLAAAVAAAAPFLWNGAASANWSATTPWSTGVAPANDGTADISFRDLAASLTSTVNTNWSVNSLTFSNAGSGTAAYALAASAGTSLTIGAGGITQSVATGESISASLIASASQTWNFNNAGGSLQSVVMSGNMTLNDGVVVTVTGNKNFRVDSGTTTLGTGASFTLDGTTLQAGVAQLNNRFGNATHPLTISNASSWTNSFTTNNSPTGGPFVTPLHFINGLANSNFNFYYGQYATITATGAWSGAGIVGGGVNGKAIISIAAGGSTYDDRSTWFMLQGDNSGLTSTADPGPATQTSAIRVIAGILVADHANALGPANSLGVIFGNNSTSISNGVSGIEATNGNDVSSKFYLRNVVNGSNQRNQVGVLGLYGAGSVNFSGAIYLDNMNPATVANASLIPALKLTAPAGGTAIFSGVIANKSSSTSDTLYTPVAILGGGTVALTGNNTYKGTTQIRGGTLLLGHAGAMGAATSTVSLGGTVAAPGGGDVAVASTAEIATVSTFTAGVLTFTGVGYSSLDGIVLNNGDRILYKDANNNPERNGVYVRNSATQWTRATDLNTAAPWVAGLRIHVMGGTANAGQNFYLTHGLLATAVLNSTASDNTAARFLLNPDAAANADVALLTDAALTITRNISVTNNLSTGKSLLGGNSADASTFAGLVTLSKTLYLTAATGGSVDVAGNITGGFGVTKEGPGTVSFSTAKSYLGATAVTDGTLVVNSTLASSAVNVGSAGTLQGSGSVSSGVTVTGTLAPGNRAVGTLTVGSASLATGGTLAVEIDGATGDQLVATGALDLSGATLTVSLLGGGWTQPSYVIAQGAPLTGTFASVPGGFVVDYTATQATLRSIAAYFVAPSGKDTNNGLSVAAPFATIQKAATMMVAGNTCLIRGGVYRETITLPRSGTAAAPITFAAYNNETVTISGTDPITGWTHESPNIYRADSMPAGWVTLGEGNQVFQGAGSQASLAMKPEARWPNVDDTDGTVCPWQNSTLAHPAPYSALGDWSYVDSIVTDSYLTGSAFADAQLPSHPDPDGYWIGARVHIMSGDGWYLRNPLVTAYTDATRTLTTDDTNAPGAYGIKAGNEYYITGKKGEMDSAGEWFFDTNPAVQVPSGATLPANRLCFWSAAPPANVEIKSRPYGFSMVGKSFIKLLNLDFFGCTLQTYQGSYPKTVATDCTLDGLSMRFLAHSRLIGADPGLILGSRSVLRNSELAYSSNGMLYLTGSDERVINNHLHHNAYNPNGAPSVSASGYGGEPMFSAYRNLVSHNTIHTVGHACLGSVGRAAIVEYNDLYDAMNLSTDGGIFYTSGEAGNAIVRYNLMHDTVGPVGHTGNGAQGFYLDNEHGGWIVHHNIIWNLKGCAMQYNARNSFCMVFNNTTWNCQAGAMVTSTWVDGETGCNYFNNLFHATPNGNQDTWNRSDVRNNFLGDPKFVDPANRNFQLQASSGAIQAGTVIPGVTDGFIGSAPDLGALASGAPDWTAAAGCHTTPPTPDPVYAAADISYANQLKDGSFESGSLAPNWTTVPGSNCGLLNSSAWYDSHERTGNFGLQFGGGDSEVSQVVTGLLPDSRYKFYCGVEKTDAAAVVKVGVRAYGYADQEVTVPTTGVWQGSAADPVGLMFNVPFITGARSTSATVYVKVTRAANSSVAKKNADGSFPTVAASSTYLGNYNNSTLVAPWFPPTGVYVDDLSVQRANEAAVSNPSAPLVYYALNETGGLSAADSGLNGRTGTVVNAATPLWQPGVSGNALGFDGVNDHLETPAITTPAALTVACWAKSNTANWNANGCLVSKRPSFVLCPNMGGKSISFILYNSSSGLMETLTWTPAAGFDLTAWHHYAGVFSPAAQLMSFYVDGVLATWRAAAFAIKADTWDSTTGELAQNVGKIYIGRDDYWSGTRNFNGLLDEVRIYDSALTAQAIHDLAAGDATQMLHLTFDASAGATKAWDSSIYNRTGVLTNMSAATAWVKGITDGALRFDGVDDYVRTPAMDLPAELTLTCWAKGDGAVWGNNGGCLISARPVCCFTPIAGTRNLLFSVNTAAPVSLAWTAPPGFDVAAWHHYAAIYSPTAALKMAIYVDGVCAAAGDGPGALVQATGPVVIGADDAFTQPYVEGNVTSGRHFRGTLDDVRIYSRALAWTELLDLSHQIYAAPYASAVSMAGGGGLPNSWMLRYGLDASLANTASDDSADHDGLGLLLEYAFNQSPLADSSAALPVVTTVVDATDHQTYLTFTYLRRTDSPQLSYTVETSAGLLVWNNGPACSRELSATPSGDGVTEVVSVRILPAISPASGRRLVRLTVSSP